MHISMDIKPLGRLQKALSFGELTRTCQATKRWHVYVAIMPSRRVERHIPVPANSCGGCPAAPSLDALSLTGT